MFVKKYSFHENFPLHKNMLNSKISFFKIFKKKFGRYECKKFNNWLLRNKPDLSQRCYCCHFLPLFSNIYYLLGQIVKLCDTEVNLAALLHSFNICITTFNVFWTASETFQFIYSFKSCHQCFPQINILL